MYRKRAVILLVLISVLLVHFWLGSRYPAIDEKAAMAGEAVLEDVLSFEAALPTSPDDPFWERVGKSTVNWTLTNRQGMTFGVLLATLVLTLLKSWPIGRGSRGSLRDIFKGILIGTPLGVCVNCAAPIAYGMNRTGVQHGTSLATMLTSPSLNIIVVTMMFSLLPMYMAVTKVAVTFLFLLLVLPLLLRLARPGAPPVPQADAPTNPAVPIKESWAAALLGLLRPLLQSFVFIFLRTVPLMLLAGFLGSAMANLLPLEAFASWQAGFGTMALVALLGTFAPVPIAFDVVLVQALLVAGLPPVFAVILLITLGMFSIYPFLIVSRMLSLRFATLLFAAVAVTGLATGYFALGYEAFEVKRNQRVFAEQLGSESEPAPPPAASNSTRARPQVVMAVPQPAETVLDEPGLRVEARRFAGRSPAALRPFDARPGRAFGLVSEEPMLLDLMLPFSQGRGIAAGDFDNDGWPDLALAENLGISLFRNTGGQGFEHVMTAAPDSGTINSLVVAFVDVDNDGCLDLFSGGFGDNDWFLLNECGAFAAGRWVAVPKQDGLMTQAASFADADRDGDLDFLVGNWFFLIPRTAPSDRNVNYMVRNLGGLEFLPEALDEIHGATLSVLLSDFDRDGRVDRVIGNDYQEPDSFYRGTGQGAFEPLLAGGPIPASPVATMSVDSADIDNDLDLDLFLSGKVNDFSVVRHRDKALEERRQFVIQRRKAFEQDYCGLFEIPEDRARCRAEVVHHGLIRNGSLVGCRRLDRKQQQDECMVTLRIKNALVRRDWTVCEDIPESSYPVHRAACEAYAGFDAQARPNVAGYQYLDLGAIPQTGQGNVLLVQEADGRFTERSEAMGVFDGHWAWNARFADLDQDEWQDLYLVNGWWLETSIYPNDFFHNQQGEGFTSRAEDFGLDGRQKQHAFVYLDLDRDGDLDIVTRSLAGDLQVYLNSMREGHSIVFDLRDEGGNTHGVGARVTIHYGENGERHQLRELKAGGGFVSFDEPMLHFGLGAWDRVHRVVVDWPDGGRSEIDRSLSAGYRYEIRRSAGPGP